MPSKPNSSDAAKPVCNVERVSREWKALPGVRHVAVQRDRLFESHIQGESHEKVAIKFCIKDAVHNQQVLIPLLERMSVDKAHPIPHLKPLAQESLSFGFIINFLIYFLGGKVEYKQL